ncbi:transcription antitermination factor NusB [Lentisphaerota bacterium WC36G]|nr:methyltransferase domain-containing protein [Lentisphaerae bacterium WC36]
MKKSQFKKSSRKNSKQQKKTPESLEIEKNIHSCVKCITTFEEDNISIDDFFDDYFALDYSIERKRCSSLIFSYFRNKALIDYMVNNSANKLNKKIRRLLVIGTTLIHFQEALHTPVIVDVIVEIAKNQFGRTKGNFVNAVMRTIGRMNIAELKEQAPKSVLYNLPKFYYKNLLQEYSANEVEALTAVYQQIPALTLRTKEVLSNEEINDLDLSLLPLPEWSKNAIFYTVNNAQKLFNSEILKSGRGYIQDPSTVMAINLIDFKGSENVIDLCAAPGGKSILVAEKLTSKGKLTACDRSERRLKYLRENFSIRNFDHKIDCLNLLNDEELNKANESFAPQESFDVVIIDVPCSNTGVIRHRPDALWRLNNKSLNEVIDLQQQIISRAAKLVKPNGILLYSSCSIEKRENSDLVAKFIEKNNDQWQLQKELQLLPTTDFDGAYGAIIKRC